MYLKGGREFKGPSGTMGYGSPCHGDGTLRDLYSSSHTRDSSHRSQDAPEGNETP